MVIVTLVLSNQLLELPPLRLKATFITIKANLKIYFAFFLNLIQQNDIGNRAFVYKKKIKKNRAFVYKKKRKKKEKLSLHAPQNLWLLMCINGLFFFCFYPKSKMKGCLFMSSFF
jgi:hypothetical protein